MVFLDIIACMNMKVIILEQLQILVFEYFMFEVARMMEKIQSALVSGKQKDNNDHHDNNTILEEEDDEDRCIKRRRITLNNSTEYLTKARQLYQI